ncbi:MAG: DegT/DnrJ/EryC1/StrS family aminotransferase [Candidatus Omnitrophota bacterium]
MIPLFKPSIGEDELNAVREAFESGWIGLGPKTEEFEHAFGDYIGVKFAIGTNSCSAALHLALMVTGIEGKEVITPSLTFISANHAILYNRGIPVFADVCPDTLTVEPKDIIRKITPNTKAIIVMHYGGHPVDMAPILDIAKAKGIAVVEDVAHACGGEYNHKKLGSLGDIACFSFHAVKNLTTGEGGMITTNNEGFDRRLRRLRWVGITKDTWSRSEMAEKYFWYYDVVELGYKYHMSDINAAIGLVQLKKLDRLNDIRRRISMKYNEGFKGLSWLKTPVVKQYAKCVHHNYVVKVEDRDGFIAHLRDNGIAAGVHYIPNHHYAMYKNFKADVPVTENVWKEIVTLPLFTDLKEEEVNKIIEAVRSFK